MGSSSLKLNLFKVFISFLHSVKFPFLCAVCTAFHELVSYYVHIGVCIGVCIYQYMYWCMYILVYMYISVYVYIVRSMMTAVPMKVTLVRQK